MQTRSSIGCGARSKFWADPNLPKERTALEPGSLSGYAPIYLTNDRSSFKFCIRRPEPPCGREPEHRRALGPEHGTAHLEGDVSVTRIGRLDSRSSERDVLAAACASTTGVAPPSTTTHANEDNARPSSARATRAEVLLPARRVGRLRWHIDSLPTSLLRYGVRKSTILGLAKDKTAGR